MLTKISKFAGLAASALTLAFVTSSQALADNSISSGASAANPSSTNVTSIGSVFNIITTTLLYIIGAIAVIMLIVGGLQYVLSSGDSKRVESAKNTILFAIVGIVVASLAFVIVSFVTGKFGA